MKSKIIKKVLAIVLACSTVMTMSGMVMAGSGRPKKDKPTKKTIGNKRPRSEDQNEGGDEESKDEENEGKKRLKIGEVQYIEIDSGKEEKEVQYIEIDSGKEEKEVQYIEIDSGKKEKEVQYIEIDSGKKEKIDEKDKKVEKKKKNESDNISDDLDEVDSKKSNLISKFNDLFENDFKYLAEKIEFAEIVRDLAANDFFNKYTAAEINRLMKKLIQCLTSNIDHVKADVAQAMALLTEKCDLDQENIESMLSGLQCCLQTENGNIKSNVIKTILNMANGGLISKFQEKQVIDVTKLLWNCSGPVDDQEKSLKIQQMQNISHIMNQCLVSLKTDSVKKHVATFICCWIQYLWKNGTFAKGGLGDKSEKELIRHLTRQLIICSDSNQAQKYVVQTIGLLARYDLLVGYDAQQIAELSNILVRLSNNVALKIDVALAIGRLAEGGLIRGGFFAGFSKEQRLELTNALINCSTDSKAKSQTAYAINRFIHAGLIKGYSRSELCGIENALISCSYDYFAKWHVASTISLLAKHSRYFRGYNKQAILRLVSVLSNCAKNVNAEKNVARAIGFLTYSGCFKELSEHEFNRVLALFKSCFKETFKSGLTSCRVDSFGLQ